MSALVQQPRRGLHRLGARSAIVRAASFPRLGMRPTRGAGSWARRRSSFLRQRARRVGSERSRSSAGFWSTSSTERWCGSRCWEPLFAGFGRADRGERTRDQREPSPARRSFRRRDHLQQASLRKLITQTRGLVTLASKIGTVNIASVIASITSVLTPLGTVSGYLYGRMQGRGAKESARIERHRFHDDRAPELAAILKGGPDEYILSLRLESVWPISRLHVTGMRRGVGMFFGPEDPDGPSATKMGHGEWATELRKGQEATWKVDFLIEPPTERRFYLDALCIGENDHWDVPVQVEMPARPRFRWLSWRLTELEADWERIVAPIGKFVWR
jgi:hypothetical protein